MKVLKIEEVEKTDDIVKYELTTRNIFGTKKRTYYLKTGYCYTFNKSQNVVVDDNFKTLSQGEEIVDIINNYRNLNLVD